MVLNEYKKLVNASESTEFEQSFWDKLMIGWEDSGKKGVVNNSKHKINNFIIKQWQKNHYRLSISRSIPQARLK
jgi:hypothetical protein